jgi:hypothetical protein
MLDERQNRCDESAGIPGGQVGIMNRWYRESLLRSTNGNTQGEDVMVQLIMIVCYHVLVGHTSSISQLSRPERWFKDRHIALNVGKFSECRYSDEGKL